MPTNGRKLPRREDIPDDVPAGDILFELRTFVHSFEGWRDDVGPGIGFAVRIRNVARAAARASVLLIPVALVFLAAWLGQT